MSTREPEPGLRERTADWVAEGPEGISTAPVRVPGGWCVLNGDGEALCLDDELAVLARFPAPDGVGLSLPGRHAAVSADRRWAAFAGDGQIAVVDAGGRTVWRTLHPDLLGAGGVRLPGAVAFPPGDGHLLAFVPVSGGGEEGSGAGRLERWVVELPSGLVRSRTATGYREREGRIRPDGQGSGEADLVREGCPADGPAGHLVLDARTLEPAARVHYPDPRHSPRTAGIVGGGDGTWVTWAKDQPLQRWRLLPERMAELSGEAPVETVDAPVRLPYGWSAVATDGAAVLLGEDLRLLARFPAPGPSPVLRAAVSRDLRWAAFAGLGYMAAVDADGRTVWQVRHPDLMDCVFTPLPGEVVFPPEDAHLWAFVPVLGDNDEEDGAGYLERRVIELATGRVLSVSPETSYFERALRIHPDGRTFGETAFDADGEHGAWVRWTGEGTASLLGRVYATPQDVHPDRLHWLASGGTGPVLGRFDSADTVEYWDEWYEYEDTCFASDRDILVRRTAGERVEHVLVAMSDIKAVAAAVRYPGADGAPGTGTVVGGNDGTWVTCEDGRPLRRWRLRDQRP
ncbi:hypothetical protein ACIBCM_06910 [Streptomyces sp. NPDC051018]|uniref:hypothetical protein n=1 Tax=Streptomyces sp. NPDC051018 TaxID=3365639 RepID=UPI0037B6493C